MMGMLISVIVIIISVYTDMKTSCTPQIYIIFIHQLYLIELKIFFFFKDQEFPCGTVSKGSSVAVAPA